ncbi:MAG: hypothetical protein M1409_06335, partial [Actinobacteria bacterium]|nr:hypothetical protein [Actinomycetota bacterium]
MISTYLLPIISLLVLPIGWIEYKILQKTWFGVFLGLLNIIILYGSWFVSIYLLFGHFSFNIFTFIGFLMILAAPILWVKATAFLIKIPGQMHTLPESLVVDGAYRWIRHPLYLGHILIISGALLVFGTLKLFLETPILLIIAIIASRYEEKTRLLPKFGDKFLQYKAHTPFILPLWGWLILGIVYAGVIIK